MIFNFTTPYIVAHVNKNTGAFSRWGISVRSTEESYKNSLNYAKKNSENSPRILKEYTVSPVKVESFSDRILVKFEDGKVPFLQWKWAVVFTDFNGNIDTGVSILFERTRKDARISKDLQNFSVLKGSTATIYKVSQSSDGSIVFIKS